jgi:hypothetical protein
MITAQNCRDMQDPFDSETPLAATFTLTIDGKRLRLQTVGAALRFITENRCVEWMEYYGAYNAARAELERAAENAMRSRAATDALRILLSQSKLL